MEQRHCRLERAARQAQMFKHTRQRAVVSFCMLRLEDSVQFYACSDCGFSRIAVGVAELHIGTVDELAVWVGFF
eukprot:12134354-Alexandrium_andersonii.AAC.1